MRSKFKWIFTLLMAFTMQFSFAQEKTITGTVSDATGPIPGANVVVQGTTRGVQTNFDGSYTIKAKEGEKLVYSFMGMNDVVKTVGASNVINTVLSDNTQQLKEVVIGAVGIKKKKSAVTSSYSTVNNEDLKAANNPDAVRALVGKVSGVTINGTSNGVGGGNSIRVRSMLSLTGNTEALVVIDNVISTADVMASLPADVIQNVTVLKGAQGAALYGSQGKQGVVVVTTKKGAKDDKFTVAVNSAVDFEEINFIPERQQSYGQGWYGAWDPQENGGWGELFDGSIRAVGIPNPDGTSVEAPYSARGNDEIKKFYQQGQIYQNNINVNAGGADGFVNLNIGNLRRDFILEGDNLNRNTIVLNAGKKAGKLTVGGTFTLTNTRTKQADVNAQTSRADYTLLTNLLQTASNVPIELFKDRGVYGWNGYYQNPWLAKKTNRLFNTDNYVNAGINAAYELNKNMSVSYTGSYQFRNNSQESHADQVIGPAEALADFSSTGNYFQSNLNSSYYYGDLLFNMNYDLTDKVGFKANIGQNMQYTLTERRSQGGFNLDIPGFYHISNVLFPENPSLLVNRKIITKTIAGFANFDLNYEDYLFLNATARYEGNSVAAKGNQFYFYPSAGVSFVPTKAFDGLKDNKVVSNLKVFANYTQVGSLDPVAAYDILSLAAIAADFAYPDTGNSYNNLTAITDPNIKPEKYTTYEAGINLGLFRDRVNLDVSAYQTNTTDLITDVTVSSTTGLNTMKGNNGELEAKGLEVDLAFMPYNTDNFKWNTRLSYTTNDTKVVDAGDSNKVVLFNGGNSNVDFDISAVEGQSFPYITGTDWMRDDQGRIILNAEGRPTVDATFKNLAKATPDYILGLTNSFEYKGIGLSFTMDYRTGHSFISQTKYNLTWNGHLVESGNFDRNVGFLMPNSSIADPGNPGQYIDNTSVLTGGFYTSTGVANRTQDYFGQASQLGWFNLVDATALKIREIALSYSLPKKMIEKAGLTSFKLSVNARNPFVWLADNNRGYSDPEASSQVNTSNSVAGRTAQGTLTNTSRNGLGFIGDAQYPSTRTVGFSINASF
ncbi:SusC/RagA family TonB-linked outer membrane protein [Flavobacterium amniphilum]|uniref:SusC/RagA family TonB-linked outer membrane protein n=1 Tax=Flavobacterium amniphilum TaxID=1834035 RepID=UPI002029CD15|nr:SusC/RagA family TonB-linked outer membrane protein [Flavobacterium amniphilum]MCL9807341.1 SusC/RagA family TonB-linked outer membrane protein [Flavobacterium amniphilum]